MSLIQLASPAEASPLRQPNKRVRCAPRSCRASLQTAPRVPSPHLGYYGRAPGDGAPFSFRPWRNTLLRRTAPQLFEAPRILKKAQSKEVSLYSMRSNRQSPKAIDGAVSAYLAKCTQIADPEVARFGQLSPSRLLKVQQAKIPHEKSKGLRAGSIPSKRGLILRGMLTPAGQAFVRSCAPLRRCKGEHYDRHSTSGRRARRY